MAFLNRFRVSKEAGKVKSGSDATSAVSQVEQALAKAEAQGNVYEQALQEQAKAEAVEDAEAKKTAAVKAEAAAARARADAAREGMGTAWEAFLASRSGKETSAEEAAPEPEQREAAAPAQEQTAVPQAAPQADFTPDEVWRTWQDAQKQLESGEMPAAGAVGARLNELWALKMRNIDVSGDIDLNALRQQLREQAIAELVSESRAELRAVLDDAQRALRALASATEKVSRSSSATISMPDGS